MTQKQREFLKLASLPGANILRIYYSGEYDDRSVWRIVQADGKWHQFNCQTGDRLRYTGLLQVAEYPRYISWPITGSYVYDLTDFGKAQAAKLSK